MIYAVDIDNTICKTEGRDYENAIPIPENIAKINKLFDEGNVIIYWTSRGMSSKIDHDTLTRKQLHKWGAKHNSINMHKPSFDFLIDDKAIKIEDL